MGVRIDIVAQSAMDRYYKEYKASVQFFDIEDFTAGCAFAYGRVLQEMYQLMYAELRSEKTDGLVSFDPLILNEQILPVEKVGNVRMAKFTHPIMSFGFSDQSIGVQQVTVVEPTASFGEDIERSSKTAQWQMKYVPLVNKLFFIPTKEGLIIEKKGFCNVSKVAVSYIPAPYDKNNQPITDFQVPEGMVDEIIAECIALIQSGGLAVVKKTNDRNPNMVMESEINKNSVR